MLQKILALIEKRIYCYLVDYRWYSRWGLSWDEFMTQKKAALQQYYANMYKIMGYGSLYP